MFLSASRRAWSAATLALALSACASHAHQAPSPVASGRLADVTIVNRDTGERLPLYWHNGRRHVAGVPGHRYAIELANRSGARVLTVVSVDGVNAVTGETASWDQSGYVLVPWQRWEVRGWRKSNERIAAFEFTSLADSYAARTGRPHEVGAIGIAVFRERVPPQVLRPRSDHEAFGAAKQSSRDEPIAQAESPAAPSASDSGARAEHAPAERRAQERLGTGHGRSESSRVTETAFERARATPDEVITIYYNSRENLIAAGVIPSWPTPPHLPNPFPLSGGFVPDPPR
jgi:hypothetical protein